MDIGSAVGRAAGLSEAKLRALNEYETNPVFNEVERLVLRYAIALTETPADVPDELFDALKRHFDAGQLVELTSAIAWENYRARFNRAFEIAPDGFSDGAFCALPERTARPGEEPLGTGAKAESGRT
jgi:4-carboxymuconolactone decarboxylase